ncbi:MAG: site-2 protease family protein [Candidatus Omnitrophota bacterium]
MGIIASLIIFLVAVTIHECAHAFTAYKLGDMTAKKMGRLSLNPLTHIDPFGTIIFPVMLIVLHSPVLFGWAKPVPINFANLNNPKKDMIWVGLAGPAANFAFALMASIVLKIFLNTESGPAIFSSLLQYAIIVNIVLAVFNLIPIPPLDGSRVLMGLLPRPLAITIAKLEPYGFIVLFALLYMGLFDVLVWPIATHITRLLLHI